jgi:cell division septal protein FtsQ
VPIEQVQKFINTELHRRRLLIFKNDNYFIFARVKMKNRLQDAFYLEVNEIKKKFPHTLSIKVHERISAFVVQTPEGYFTLGTDGKAITDVEKPQAGQLLIADERALRERNVPREYLETATTIAEDWQQTIASVNVMSFHLNDDSTRIIVSTNKAFRVYIDPKKEIHPQLARLSVFLQDRNFEVPPEYIDLRYDDNIYVR